MNIFAVHDNPKVAASMLCDQHVVKMIIENCQMMSAVMDMKYKDEHRTWCDEPHAWYGLPGYFKSVKKHPCTLWLMESINNCKWLVDHHRATVLEYIKRYGKVHKLESTPMIYEAQLQYLDLPKVKRTKFANATPYKEMDDPIEAYRLFYNADKSRFARWRYTDKPSWYMAS